jgi:hypothetical protein
MAFTSVQDRIDGKETNSIGQPFVDFTQWKR